MGVSVSVSSARARVALVVGPALLVLGACTPLSDSAADDAKPPTGGTELRAAVDKLPVKPEARAGYERDAFRHWIDENHDGCNTRMEVLIEEAVKPPQQGERCKLTGGEWLSYYDEVTVTDASKLDIDHVVPLAEAWDSGASGWTPERREAFANDLTAERSLVAVTASTNRSKGDKDPAEWMPPAEGATCTYLVDWVSTKARWGLAVDRAERKALRLHAADCPDASVRVTPAP